MWDSKCWPAATELILPTITIRSVAGRSISATSLPFDVVLLFYTTSLTNAPMANQLPKLGQAHTRPLGQRRISCIQFVLMKLRQRKRAATSNATSSTETQPPVATPEEPPAAEPSKSEEPSTTEPPKAEESVPPPPEEPAAPTEEAKPVEEARTWTPAEDIALLSLKRDKMTWKEIGDKLGGIEKSELTKRYKELAPAGVEGSKDKGEGETTSDGESASTKENDDDAKGKSGKGGKGQAGKKGGKGKGQAAKQKESSGPENTDGAVVADRTEKKPKGILKKNSDGIFELDKATTIPDGATSIGGRPIIYLEDDDPIDMDDVSHSCVLLSKILR